MPPKKSRKQSNPKKSKGKTQAEKMIEEVMEEVPVQPAAVEKAMTTRGRSRAQPKKSINKKNTNVEEVKKVSNSPIASQKRLHTLVKTSDKLTTAQPDPLPPSSSKRPSQSSSKLQSSPHSAHNSDDEDGSGDKSDSNDDDPRIKKQKEQRRERYEKSEKKEGKPPKKNSRSKSGAGAKKMSGNKTGAKVVNPTTPAKAPQEEAK